MPGIYKLFTAIVAIIGNISLISTGQMNPLFSIIGVGLLFGYYRSFRGYPQLPKWAVGVLSLSTFIVFLLNFYINKDVFISVAQMTLIFQTIKSFDIKEAWDPLQVFFVSLLQLLMASELTNSIYFGIIFLLFLVFIVISILLGHFVSEGQREFRPFLMPTAFIALLTLVFTIIFFVSIPRFHSGLWGRNLSRGIRSTGFSERVDFGSFGRVKLDETVVMRMVIRPDIQGPHYLRGMTFDYFDGKAWYDRIRKIKRIFRRPYDFNINVPEGIRKYEAEIYLEPLDSDVIFTFKKPYKIESEGFFLRKDSAGSFYMKQKVSKRFFYRLFSVDDYYNDNAYLHSYLQTPNRIAPIKRLTEQIASDIRGQLQKVEAIRDYLLKNYKYSLFTKRPPDGITAIEDFLFNSKKGYCEHFATAMTLMLRSIGIPARLVTGFLSSQKNDFGDYYLIRQSDAHSWVEAFINGRWLTFDPTPPVIISHSRAGILLFLDMIKLKWSRYVVGFSAYDQLRMANYIFDYRRMAIDMPRFPFLRIMLFIIAMSILLTIAYKLKSRGLSYARYRGISAEYARFMRMVSRCGGRVLPSSSTEEVLREAMQTERFDHNDVRRFIEAYRFLRFSGDSDSDLLRDFYERAKRLKRQKRQDKGDK